ncbi:HK97 family phage prohead protease [Anaerosporobacter faecicola]|uniref:HK97 family phage prohead protease n=1 Tax=Anaerosporobacter faecicola TaxID=2718714 RepID=UPI00143B0600|nr:HK97 family phage prohead protease [Anaerosporobacter faecicola]
MAKSTKKVKQTENLTRELGVNSIRALGGEESRKFEISFSSEEPYERWFGTEILDHNDGCVDLTRLSEMGCVLFNHNRDKVIGKVNKVWIKDKRGYAEIEFDEDAESEVIYQKVKNDTLKGVSIGYRICTTEEVAVNQLSQDGRFKGPCTIAKRWFPYEISIVSVPADSTVGVGRDLEEIEDTDKRSLSYYEAIVQINSNSI